jgi:hypothetical protein
MRGVVFGGREGNGVVEKERVWGWLRYARNDVMSCLERTVAFNSTAVKSRNTRGTPPSLAASINSENFKSMRPNSLAPRPPSRNLGTERHIRIFWGHLDTWEYFFCTISPAAVHLYTLPSITAHTHLPRQHKLHVSCTLIYLRH